MNENKIEKNQPNDFGRDFLVFWDDIPDIGLYMDQVVQVLNQRVDASRFITPNMINNYVKHQFLEPPVQKRYSRKQIMRLYIMMQLKQVLQIPAISLLLDNLEASFSDDYETLRTEQNKNMAEILDVVSNASKDTKSSASLALQFALKASALRYAAELVLAGIPDHRPEFEVDR